MSSVDQVQFLDLLRAVMSMDNHARTVAEQHIKAFKDTNPTGYLNTLSEIFCSNNDDQAIVMISGVLLKNFFSDKTVYRTLITNMPQEQLETIQKALLMRFGDPQFSKASRNVAKQIIIVFAPRITAERRNASMTFNTGGGFGGGFGRNNNSSVPNVAWPGLIKQLVEVASNPAMILQLRSACLDVLGELCCTLIQYDDFIKEIPTMSQTLLASFEHVNPTSGDKKDDAEYLEFASYAAALVGHLYEGNSLYPSSFPLAPFCNHLSAPFLDAFEGVCANKIIVDREELRDLWIRALNNMSGADSQSFFVNTGNLQRLQNVLFACAKFGVQDLQTYEFSEACFEHILTIAEESGKSWFKTNKQLCSDIFSFCIKIMEVGLNDLPEGWKTRPTHDEDDIAKTDEEHELKLFVLGSTTIDRLGEVTRGQVIQPLIAPIIQDAVIKMNDPTQWKVVAVAHGVITYSFSSLKDTLAPMLPQIMANFITPSLFHSHEYVRYLAFLTCAQIATDLAPTFQKKFHDQLLPIAMKKLHEDKECPRVEEAAGIFFSNFFDSLDNAVGEDDDDDDENLLQATKYLNSGFKPIIQAFLTSLSDHDKPDRKPSFVLVTHIRGLCDTCNVANKRVFSFATEILNVIQPLVRKYHDIVAARGYDFSTLSSDADYRYDCNCLYYTIEVATIVFSHCPATEELRGSALELAGFLVSLLENADLKPRDELLKFCLRGLCCLAEHLRGFMADLLPRVMAKLLEYANLQCDYISDEYGDGLPPGVTADQESYEDPELGTISMVQVVQPGMAPRVIRIQQDNISTKELASNILFTLADTLKGLMFEYVPALAECALQLLKFAAHGEVRENGALILENLVQIIKTAPHVFLTRSDLTPEVITGALQHLARISIPQLMEAMSDETEDGVLARMANALKEIVVCASAEFLIESFQPISSSLDDVVQNKFGEFQSVRDQILPQMDEEDPDEAMEEFEAAMDDAREVVGVLVDTIQNLIKACPEPYSAWFVNTYLKFVTSFFKEQKQRFDAVIEHEAAVAANTSKGGAKKGGKLGAKKSAKAASAKEVEPLDPQNDPTWYVPDFIYYSSLAGSFLENSSADSFFTQNAGHVILEQFFTLLPLIDHEEPLQAVAWSIGAAITTIARISNADGSDWLVAPPDSATVKKPHEYVKRGLEVAAAFFTKTRYADLEDEDVAAAVENIFSLAVRGITFYDSKPGRWADAPLQEIKFLVGSLTEQLPLDADEVEAKTVTYPLLIRSLRNAKEDHPLFGKSSEIRAALMEAFGNMAPEDFGEALNEITLAELQTF